MTTETIQTQSREFDTLQEAFNAATEAAMMSFGLPVSGTLYTQGGRRFISTGLPIKMLLSLARRQSASKKEDPATTRNRPLDQGHVREIAEYLRSELEYLVPPIILNAAQPLQTFVYRSPAATRSCVFVLPPEEYLYVTDGQHRLEALRQAMAQRPELERDSVGVTIIEEANIDKVHQDFFDAAQVKPLAKALLVLRTANTTPVWRVANRCFHVRYLAENCIQISAKLPSASSPVQRQTDNFRPGTAGCGVEADFVFRT